MSHHKFSKQMVSLIKATYNVEILPVFASTKVGVFSLLSAKHHFPIHPMSSINSLVCVMRIVPI